MSHILEFAERSGHVPFELDFLRELGFTFALDWDGEVQIECPEDLEPLEIANLVGRFHKGIRKRLEFEGQKSLRVHVGGPLNGQPYHVPVGPCRPMLYHLRRKEWAVYHVKCYRDPRAWFVGLATSQKKARALWHHRKRISRHR